jgi:accessory colonization factor AcfC
MKAILIATAILALGFADPASSQVLQVYGPGGPAPAMKEAAQVYGARTGTQVRVTAGPTKDWIESAKKDADVVYSGSENMMTDFVKAMEGQIDEKTIDPLYLRASNILVRPGNPKRIRGLRDIVRPGHRVIVVQGSGQAGLWEDMAGRSGEISMVRGLRKNIVGYAGTSADAKAMWLADPTIDAWIIWGIWQKANPTIADSVAVEPQYRIYRDMGVGLTARGKGKVNSKRFVDFLRSPAGAAIFTKWGWLPSK